MNEKNVLFTIFGGTGDLAQRKLYPSLFRLYKKGNLSEHFAVIVQHVVLGVMNTIVKWLKEQSKH